MHLFCGVRWGKAQLRTAMCLTLLAVFLASFAFHNNASGIAKASTITVSSQSTTLSAQLMISSGGTFGKSGDATVSVSTDNFTGYNLTITASSGDSLENSDGDEIESISTTVTEQAFSTNSAYNNKWGFRPSQYVTSSGGVDTVVSNSDYLPAPTNQGLLIARTTSANSLDGNNDMIPDSYTFSFGARIDSTLPAGSYSATYIIAVVANDITYNVTYDDSSSVTSETVTNMPSPNPQALQIAGATPTAQSHAPLSSTMPAMTSGNLSFNGWCDVPVTYNSVTQNYDCSGNTYSAGAEYPIDQTSSATNITLYAIWIDDPFPMVWSQMGKCIFDGAEDTNNGYISGSECSDHSTEKYIDTGIALYSNDNYQKDYEVHFTIDRYVYNEQPDSQSTLFNDKLSSSVTGSPYGGKSPGIVIRKASASNSFEIKSTYTTTPLNGDKIVVKTGSNAFAGTDVRVFRINGVIYTSIDGGPLELLQDMTDPAFNQQFGLSAWFGAYPDNINCTEGCTQEKRWFEGELSNMYIKLGDFDESNLHTITLNANGGTLTGGSTLLIMDGTAIGNSIADPTRTNWLFDGWLDSNNQAVSSATVPDSDDTYTAQWTKTVTLAQITNSTINLDLLDTESIVVSNSAELEPYTFSSSDSTIASVNSSTGLVTGVGSGTATITMTGTRSGATQTITVNVDSSGCVMRFDEDGGYQVDDISVGQGETLTEIPYTEKPGYVLEGWYTGTNGSGMKLDSTTQITADIEYHAYWLVGDFVCKVAEERHFEYCSRTTSPEGCLKYFASGERIDYGHLVTSASAITPGAAYNCDVNYDGTFDAETERFYYFGTANGNAKLVYYANLINTSQTYDVALTYLPNYELDLQSPTTPVWDNPHLVTYTTGDYAGKAARFMTYAEVSSGLWGGDNAASLGANGTSLFLVEKAGFANQNITDGIWLERESGNMVSRIQTKGRSITRGVNKTTANAPRPTIDIPDAYLEKYFELPLEYEVTFDPQNETNTFTETITPTEALGNAYPQNDPTYADHLFQGWYTEPTGGTLVTSQTVPTGDVTYYAQWKKTVALANVAYNSLSIIEGATTTAQVTNSAELEAFTFSSSDTSIATVDSSTGVVTGVSEGVAYISIYGTESQTTNSNIVTINVLDPESTYEVTFYPANGTNNNTTVNVTIGHAIDGLMPPTPSYADHTFIRWYDNDTGNTVTASTVPTSAMDVYAEWKLDVTQAVISNNDLTLAVGGQITILVSNASTLEDYTFSVVDSSVATVDSTTGVITGVSAGTTDVVMTGALSGLTKTLEVEVTPPPVVMRSVTFNPKGGTFANQNDGSRQVESGTAVGVLPTPTKTDHRFFGWYKDDGTLYQEVYPTEVVNADVTYYAKWVEDTTSFPIEWAEINACTFDGVNNVSGDYCSAENKTGKFINTTQQLFTQANYEKEFEIGFTIAEYTPGDNSNQATFVNSKWESSANNYPGFVVRRYTTTSNIEVTAKWKGDDGVSNQISASDVHTVKITRRIEDVNGTDHIILYYSIDGATPTVLQDITDIERVYFNTAVWFGASANGSGNMQRPLVGTLTDMYVKIGEDTSYSVELNPNGGTLPANTPGNYNITIGDSIGALPTPTAPSANYTFGGWYDGNTLVSDGTQYIPTGNVTLVADWVYNSSNTPVAFDVSNNATRGYKTLINTWAQSPVNIGTFNKTSPINSSTWGDTSELTDAQFWAGLKNNFETNNCKVTSYGDSQLIAPNSTAWVNGSVDCAKPDEYDTLLGVPLNVYVYDTANQTTVGSPVTYAEASDGVLRNLIPGTTYKWIKDGDSTVYGYVEVTSNGSATGTRWVDTGVIRNTRDLGGLPVTYTDGNNQTVTGTLAYGRLFRGERLWENTPTTELTKLGINKEYDLGNPSEYSGNGDTTLSSYQNDQVIHYDFDYHTGDEDTTNGLTNYMRAWLAVTHIMTDIVDTNNPKNIYFHCRVGADRTGTVAYLLEGLLGVPDEARYEEYELTHLSGLYDRTRYYKQKNSNTTKFIYMMDYVQTNAQILEWYMHNPNASMALVQSFRTAMTVPSNQQQQGPQNSPAPAQQQMSPMSLNNTDDGQTDTSSTESSVPTEGYTSPLGVTETSATTEINTSGSDSPVTAGVAIVATMMAIVGGGAYVLSKQEQSGSQ